ncbi:hypothetical protein MIND_00139500 [Mycena indigotica]|uniref:Major facilitator superfamily (MFS) profile domain-containing protein n=1 Tax=Mycena indigotica TaxID=2126181 RepID=A0A8H6TGE7_9AGAR|nr:uncharacterized protein MIND_00139500 [Mycena indigotica]KAF7316211.1 hypothetical protein MIND_00139500 [Mycena indigotica]
MATSESIDAQTLYCSTLSAAISVSIRRPGPVLESAEQSRLLLDLQNTFITERPMLNKLVLSSNTDENVPGSVYQPTTDLPAAVGPDTTHARPQGAAPTMDVASISRMARRRPIRPKTAVFPQYPVPTIKHWKSPFLSTTLLRLPIRSDDPWITLVLPFANNMSSARSSFTLHEPEESEQGSKLPACLDHDGIPKYSNFSVPPSQSCVTLAPVTTDAHDDWFFDPRNPRNWSACTKWCTTAIVALYMFVSPLSSSTMAPGEAQIAARYGITNQSILAMTLSIFLLSFGMGPLVLAPVSEMYGRYESWPVFDFNIQTTLYRKWVLHIGNIFSILFHLGCAFAPNTAALIGFRFMAGLSGSAPVACGGAVVSDLFSERERASAMALYSLGPLLGPVIGPIAGGFIAQKVGVQYVYFALAGVTTFASFIGLPFLRETYAPLIKLRIAASAVDQEKALDTVEKPRPANITGKLYFLWINFSRPVYLLTHSFICFILSLYMAFSKLIRASQKDSTASLALISLKHLLSFLRHFQWYVVQHLAYHPPIKIIGFFMSTYGFSTGIAGLMYAGLGVGFVLATCSGAKFSNALYQRLSDKNGGKGEPEMRIPPILVGSFFVPLGLLWYGWSAETKLPWIMPVVGSGLFGFGMMISFLPIQLYLVDSFQYAASALSAAFLFRSLLGFSFPLFGHEIFAKLGYGWGFSMLAICAICLGIPFPIYIYYRGAALRAKSDFNH